jgi:hypothetical protein
LDPLQPFGELCFRLDCHFDLLSLFVGIAVRILRSVVGIP